MASFLTPLQLRIQLGIESQTSPTDGELQVYADSACDIVENECGPIALRTITNEYVDVGIRSYSGDYIRPGAGVRTIVLRNRPVTALTSFVNAINASVTYPVGDFVIDAGVIRRADGGPVSGPLVITYTVGYATTPAWATLAALIIGQHLWTTRRGPRRGQGSGDTSTVSGIGYAVPNQALVIMEPHRLTPAVG